MLSVWTGLGLKGENEVLMTELRGSLSCEYFYEMQNCYRSASWASQGNQFACQGSTVIIYSWQERREPIVVVWAVTAADWLNSSLLWTTGGIIRGGIPVGNRWGERAASPKSVRPQLHHSQSQHCWILLFIEPANSPEVQAETLYKDKGDSRELCTGYHSVYCSHLESWSNLPQYFS